MLSLHSYNPPGLVNKPVALSTQWLYGISHSETLNPQNKAQSPSTYCLKPVRAVARYVLAAVGTLFASVIGTFYHLYTAALLTALGSIKNDPNLTRLSDKHLIQAFVDAKSAIMDVFSFGLIPLIRGCEFMSSYGCAEWTAEYFKFCGYEDKVRHTLLQRV